MFKRLLYVALCAVLAMITTNCNDEPDPDPTPNGKNETVHRTILVYMAAYNSLGSAEADTGDIDEMLEAARNDDFNGGRLLLYHADLTGNTVLSEVTADGLKELVDYNSDGLSSVSAARMRKVIADAKSLAPADEYGIILWSHGDGWLQDGIDETASTSAQQSPGIKAFGSERGYKMNITTLADVLDGENFAFVYFDCCYMASIEVEYELRHVTPYIVGSSCELPVDGMPYNQNLRCLFADEADLVGSARNTYNLYMNTISDNGFWQTCTMSVVRTAGLENLAAATKRIYEQADSCMPEDYKPQKFMTTTTCYYYDFGHYIKALASDQDYLDWQAALNDCIVYSVATPTIWQQVKIESYSGLSTYIFTSESDAIAQRKNYATLSWYDDVASALFSHQTNV